MFHSFPRAKTRPPPLSLSLLPLCPSRQDCKVSQFGLKCDERLRLQFSGKCLPRFLHFFFFFLHFSCGAGKLSLWSLVVAFTPLWHRQGFWRCRLVCLLTPPPPTRHPQLLRQVLMTEFFRALIRICFARRSSGYCVSSLKPLSKDWELLNYDDGGESNLIPPGRRFCSQTAQHQPFMIDWLMTNWMINWSFDWLIIWLMNSCIDWLISHFDYMMD